ncbi:hypothetical protein [Streptomyces sp. NPDC055109]
MTNTADERALWIRSITDPATNAPACVMNWGSIEAVLPIAVVYTTARDLLAAAAHAEADIALIESFRETLRLDLQTIGHLIKDIRARRPVSPGKPALRINAVAGLHTGDPLVHIARGSMKAELSTEQAREIALHWTQTAVAAEVDTRLRYALGEWDHLSSDQIEDLFRTVRSLQR